MTLLQAKAEAKARRANGEDVKILKYEHIFTIPGRGVGSGYRVEYKVVAR